MRVLTSLDEDLHICGIGRLCKCGGCVVRECMLAEDVVARVVVKGVWEGVAGGKAKV